MLWAGLFLLQTNLSGAETDVRRDASVIAVEKAMPSVVNIGTLEIIERHDAYESLLREFWGPFYRRRGPDTQYSLGSGVVIDEEGIVLTNFHVVGRASKIWVRFSEGAEFEAKPIVGTTQSDVALLRILAKPGTKFTPVKFAADDDLLLGETVLALGNPFGLGGSVSRGILSSKSRRPALEGEPLYVQDWLQTDAAINPGNSGGPLINLRGELIGINVAVGQGQGIGFAIPVKRLSEALSEIYRPEIVEGNWFGALVKAGRLPLTVTAVDAKSPAELAGLRPGDQIMQLNGTAPRGFVEFARTLINWGEAQDLSLVIQRNTDRRTLKLRMVSFAALIKKRLGLSLQELTHELAKNLGLSQMSGLLVAGVDKASPAAAAALQPGMLISGINQQPTDILEAAGKMIGQKNKGDRVRLSVIVPRRIRNLTRFEEGAVDLTVR